MNQNDNLCWGVSKKGTPSYWEEARCGAKTLQPTGPAHMQKEIAHFPASWFLGSKCSTCPAHQEDTHPKMVEQVVGTPECCRTHLSMSSSVCSPLQCMSASETKHREFTATNQHAACHVNRNPPISLGARPMSRDAFPTAKQKDLESCRACCREKHI